MLGCLVRSLFRFSTVQRPFTPANWTSMSMSFLNSQPEQAKIQGVIHAMRLMECGVTSFDYDLYQWSCWRVVQQQQNLTKEELLLMMRLGKRHSIVLTPFQQHIENQLFLRIHRDYQPELQGYDQKIRKDMAQLMQRLQQKSKDYFKILQEEGQQIATKEGQQKVDDRVEKQQSDFQVAKKWADNAPQKETLKFIVDMNKKMKKRKQKEFLLTDLMEVMDLLISSGSKNLPLLQYILQLLTIHFQDSSTIAPAQMIGYVEALTYVCQQLMGEYSGNRQRYTTRSIKRIYKFQTLYYHQHLRQLTATAFSLTLQQLEQLISTYSAFPIKRRAIRRSLGTIIGEQIRFKQLQENEIVKRLVGINGKDEKMKKSFCELMGIDLQKAKQIGLYIEKVKVAQIEDENTAEQIGQQDKKSQQVKMEV